MAEEVYPGLFRIQVPLPGSPLKNLNSYVVRGQKRSMVIDTGLNREECKTALLSGLESIGVPPGAIDLFITHFHADHFGLVPGLVGEETRIFFNRPDGEVIENWNSFEPMVRHAAANGFPEDALRAAVEQHPGYQYGTGWMPPLSMIDDGMTLTYGDHTLSCIQTPGHTPGHTCLYSEKHRFLIAGDHILEDITPNIQCWSDARDPLSEYLSSLEKIRDLSVDRVLPGHRRLFTNYTQRIDSLRDHHLRRLAEIETILAGAASLSAYEVASRMTWDIKAENWKAFPVAQKWFATGEAIAHLRLLENAGRVSCIRTAGGVAYTLPAG